MSDGDTSNAISIEDTRQKLMEDNISVKDTSVFSPSHVPDTILHRKKQHNKLVMRLRSFINDGGLRQAFLTGDNSTGKTVHLKWWDNCMEDMIDETENVYYEYFNCGNESSWQDLGLSIANRFDVEGTHKGMGADELFSTIFNTFEEEDRYIIALDEFDKMTENSRSKIVKAFSRTNELNNINGDEPNLLALYSGNNAAAISELDRDRNDRTHTAGSDSKNIRYREYNEDQLADIFRERFKEGLAEDAWDDELVDYVAEQVDENMLGDIRFGLKAVQNAMELVLENDYAEVRKQHIDKAVSQELQSKLNNDLDNIRNKRIYKTLLALATLNKSKKPTAEAVKSRYDDITESGDTYHPNTARNHLNELADVDVLRTFNVGKNKNIYKLRDPIDRRTAVKVVCQRIDADPLEYYDRLEDKSRFEEEASNLLDKHMSGKDTKDTKTQTTRAKTQQNT